MTKIGCTKPLIRAELWETEPKIDGGLKQKVEFLKYHDCNYQTMKNLNDLKMSARYKSVKLIPCGKCIGCRLDYARDKAIQLSLEKLNPIYEKNEVWFLTLTYSDENLKTHTTVNIETGEIFEGISIEEKDMQNFWKRVRKKYPDKKIQYLNCMEYGNQTYRPHAHAIAFGMPLDETKFKRVGNNTQGDAIWQSDELDALWGLGGCTIGEVTFKSISYVARYTLKKTKKQLDDWFYESQGKKKEWISMSQSIGRWYYEKYKHEIYKTDTVPIKDNNGNVCRPPKSFDHLYAKEYPNEWKKVQERREKQANVAKWQQEQQTDISGYEYLKIKDMSQNQFKDLRKDGNSYEL